MGCVIFSVARCDGCPFRDSKGRCNIDYVVEDMGEVVTSDDSLPKFCPLKCGYIQVEPEYEKGGEE